jgi:predicted ATPase
MSLGGGSSKKELAMGGSALPWVDRVAFARRAVAIALADRAAAGSLDGWVFFDRGLIDAAAALEHMTGKPVLTALGQANRYHRRVFLAPAWPEIYETDPERRHGLDVALAEYLRLLKTYPLSHRLIQRRLRGQLVPFLLGEPDVACAESGGSVGPGLTFTERSYAR